MKTGLILSGGGSRGAYEIGVCKALKKLDIKIDMVYGTSVGAITAAMVAQDDLDPAEKLWRGLTTEQVFDISDEQGGKRNSNARNEPGDDGKSKGKSAVAAAEDDSKDGLKQFADKVKSSIKTTIDSKIEPALDSSLAKKFEDINIAGMPIDEAAAYLKEIVTNGGAGNSGLMELMHKYIDESKIRKSFIDFGLVVTDLYNGTGYRLYESDIPEGKLLNYVMASASCFPAVQVCEIDGKRYVDGGYFDNLPVRMAVKKGAERIIAVDLDAIGIVHEADINEAKKRCRKFDYIKPTANLGNFLVFNKENTAKLIQTGYLDAMRFYGKYDGKKYTFKKGVFSESEIESADSLAVAFALDPSIVYDRETFATELLAAYPNRRSLARLI